MEDLDSLNYSALKAATPWSLLAPLYRKDKKVNKVLGVSFCIFHLNKYVLSVTHSDTQDRI